MTPRQAGRCPGRKPPNRSATLGTRFATLQCVVDWDPAHRTLGPISAIGVDQIKGTSTSPGLSNRPGHALSESAARASNSQIWGSPVSNVVREKCLQALHILNRFHLKKSRWCILKPKANFTSPQKLRLRDRLHYNLQTVRAYLLKEDFQRFWDYNFPPGLAGISTSGVSKPCALVLTLFVVDRG
jgi:Transposase